MTALQLVLGIDTHKHVHVVVVLDALGRFVAAESFLASDAGARRLLAWTATLGCVARAGVEGTGSYGYRLARILNDADIEVIEVARPDRARRRRRGKTDLVDAEAAARAVLARDATAIPKDRRGPVGELRGLVVARRSAVKARTQATNQLKALLLDCDDRIRRNLHGKNTRETVDRCARQRGNNGLHHALRSLARRWQCLDEETRDLDQHIAALVQCTAPALLQRPGVGALCAAQLLITAGDNPHRLRSEAAFAALCGASPVEASSGKTVRHRLNRGGDRAANNALWTIAHVRLVHDERTRTYGAKRTAVGDDRKEILRRLKRYIVRELHPLIIDALAPHRATA